jgi:hypothetical protein
MDFYTITGTQTVVKFNGDREEDHRYIEVFLGIQETPEEAKEEIIRLALKDIPHDSRREFSNPSDPYFVIRENGKNIINIISAYSISKFAKKSTDKLMGTALQNSKYMKMAAEEEGDLDEKEIWETHQKYLRELDFPRSAKDSTKAYKDYQRMVELTFEEARSIFSQDLESHFLTSFSPEFLDRIKPVHWAFILGNSSYSPWVRNDTLHYPHAYWD